MAEIKTVGVVGLGLMGAGIAQTVASAGYTTIVTEVSPEFLERGLGRIRSTLERQVQKGRLDAAAMEATMNRLQGTLRWEDFAACDLVIEAVIENETEKRQVFATLDRVCPEHTILASNTSSIPIMSMAAATKRPDRVLGMHFFNPVPVMKLVEIVKALTTSPATIDTASAFARSLGKEPIQAPDRPGFIVNMLLVPYLLAAVRMLESGYASKEDIDRGMVLGANHPMGPLTLLDFVGLDTTLYIADIFFNEYKDPAYAAPVLLRQMVRAGYLGRKSGRGFYDYSTEPPR